VVETGSIILLLGDEGGEGEDDLSEGFGYLKVKGNARNI